MHPRINQENHAFCIRCDGQLGHYIGPHHDKARDLVSGAPIVTISLGEERAFRMTLKGARAVDIPVSHGVVLAMPWDTNLRWKHEVPKSASHQGKRISVTIRAFTI